MRQPGAAGRSNGSALAVIDRRLATAAAWLAQTSAEPMKPRSTRTPSTRDAEITDAMLKGLRDGESLRMPGRPIGAPEKQAEIPRTVE
jgi:hypothetical protein